MSDPNEQVGTRPLAAVLPDVGDLRADPAAYLKRGECRIGPRRVPWWTYLFVPALLVVGLHLIPANAGYAFVIGSPCMLAMLIYWAWPVPRQLILRSDGVAFVHRKTFVYCPWSLFDTKGRAFVRTAQWIDTEITLPIRIDAVPYVQYVREGKETLAGYDVRSQQFWFHAEDEVCIASVYAVRPQELGDLLLHVARILGCATPVVAEPISEREPPSTAFTASAPNTAPSVSPDALTATVPNVASQNVASQIIATPLGTDALTSIAPDAMGRGPAARPMIQATDSVDIRVFPRADRSGWITLPVTQLSFAPLCCECGRPARNQYHVQINEGIHWGWFVPVLGRLRPEKSLDILAPLCPVCRRKDVVWQIGLTALEVFFACAPLGILAWIAFARLSVCFGMSAFCAALLLGHFSFLFRRKPLQARYNDSAKTISLRFRSGLSPERMLQ